MFSGMLLGYVAYDCMHYWEHSGLLGGALKANHMRHHYVDPDVNYGISSPLFDLLLGTFAGQSAAAGAAGAGARAAKGGAPRRVQWAGKEE